MMRDEIKKNIENPTALEKTYQSDKKKFKETFFIIYPEIENCKIAEFWKSRLEYKNPKEKSPKIGNSEIILLLIASAITAFLIKIPQSYNINLNSFFFYEKNAGLIVLFGVSLYAFLTKSKVNIKHLLITFSVFITSAVYINSLPSTTDSDSLDLAYFHLPLMLWSLYGLVYINFNTIDKKERINYIKYNGELAILGVIILISGGILSGVTIGLFYAIDLHIEEFYFDYIMISGLVSIPIVATYIIKKYPFVANKIAPIIANIFSPLILITLIVYLLSILITGKDPYNDRDFLIIFNIMLLGVMGIIVFSVSETSQNKRQQFSEITLFILSIITLLIDVIALSAIIYRLGEYGFTPNRTAALGSNILIFGNLVLIMIDLYKVNFKNKEIKSVEITIAKYLPIYTIWTIFMVFISPFIFGMK